MESATSTVTAALAAFGQPFGPPEAVSPAGQRALSGVAGFAGERPTVVFAGRAPGAGSVSRRPPGPASPTPRPGARGPQDAAAPQ